jgi:peptidoglycan pentaglycine glycine transferase (the first glycine)
MYTEVLTKQQEKQWLDFVQTHPLASIHQTPNWARFQSNIPSRDKYWIIVIYERKKGKQRIVGGTLLVKHKLPQKDLCWLYSPRGPLLTYNKPKNARAQMEFLLKEIKKIAKKENAVFYRIDPLLQRPLYRKPSFSGFRQTHQGFQPNTTLTIDLAHPPEKILKQMKPKGRYNIRLAERKGIKIIEVEPPTLKNSVKTAQSFYKQIKSYHHILQETETRDHFHGHTFDHYKSMLEKLSDKNPRKGYARMYLAQYTPEGGKTKYIAGAIVTIFNDAAIYYYGASSNKYRNVMAPYLIQWHSMQEAKRQGCKEYDFLGIAPPTETYPQGKPTHPWHGVSEFKHKFGGEVIHYYLPQEYSFKPFLHLAYRILKKLRKLLRRS